MAKFKIPAENLGSLREKINHIKRKCEDLNLPFYYSEDSVEYVKERDEFYRVYTRKYVNITVEATAIVNGWHFVGQIEHNQEGNLIHNFSSEYSIPEQYFKCNPQCEHCKIDRFRNKTYIVYNEQEGFKQLGASCISLYTHGLSGEYCAMLSEFDKRIREDWYDLKTPSVNYYKVKDLLMYSIKTVKLFGFVSRKKAMEDCVDSTSTRVINFYNYFNDIDRLFPRVREEISMYVFQNNLTEQDFNSSENSSDADCIISYIKSTKESTDYMTNLRTIASADYVKEKDIGYIPAMVATYDNYMKKEQERIEKERQNSEQALVSQHMGNIGERIQIIMPTIKCVYSYDTDYGTTYIYSINDKVGNVYIWKTAKVIDQSKSYIIIGTVKNHTEYNEVKQTEITRCKLQEV